MIIVILFLFCGVILFIGAVTAVIIRGRVLEECEKIIQAHSTGLMAGFEARKALTELKKKMVVKQHKDEVQDYINLIRD